MFGLIVALAMAAPPDLSQAYFPGLRRPRADRVQVGAAGGPVILIVVDAMRPDRMDAYGFDRQTAPNLNALANDGLILTNYFVNGNWTRPSTTSLLTGLTPARHGVEKDRDRLAEQFITLAELLSGVGVPTGAVVGNGNAASAFGLGQGFDYFADTVKHWEGLPSADQVVELALPFAKKHRSKPFFLMLFFVDPHDPYHAPDPYENMFVRDPSVRLVRSPHWELGRYSPAEIERMTATYDGAVRYTDKVIGEFFEELKALGLFDKSTIIVTSDHGEAFGEHGVFLHAHHLYDEIIRAPFILRTPKMTVRGAYNHHLFQSVDLLPTVAGLYGAAVPKDLPGLDLVEHLKHPERNRPDRIVVSEFHNFGIKRQMVRTYTSKLIYQEPANRTEFDRTVRDPALLPSVSFDAETVQLFDIRLDPFEKENLFSKETIQEERWRKLFQIVRLRKRSVQSVGPVVKHLDPEIYRDLRALGYIQ